MANGSAESGAICAKLKISPYGAQWEIQKGAPVSVLIELELRGLFYSFPFCPKFIIPKLLSDRPVLSGDTKANTFAVLRMPLSRFAAFCDVLCAYLEF